MSKKGEEISATFLFISILIHLVSYFFWREIPIKNVYYITAYFVVTNAGLVLLMISRHFALTAVGTLMVCVGSWFVLMELYGKPMEWTDWNRGTLFLDGLASIFIAAMIEKHKKKANGLWQITILVSGIFACVPRC